MLRRLARLSTRVAQIGKRQDLSLRVGCQAKDELGMLAGEIDSMLDELQDSDERIKQHLQQIAEEKALVEAILTSMVDGLVVADPQAHVTFCNEAARQFFGNACGEPVDQWRKHVHAYYSDGKRLFPTEDLPLVRGLNGETTDRMEISVRNGSVRDYVA